MGEELYSSSGMIGHNNELALYDTHKTVKGVPSKEPMVRQYGVDGRGATIPDPVKR